MANKKHSQKKQNPPSRPASNTKAAVKKPVHKERGTLLSVLIVLIALHAVLATYLGYTSLKEEYINTSWALPLMTFVSVAGIVAAVGLWYWKQWGIILYAITCIIQAAVHLMMTGSLMVVFYDILPVAVLAYVISLQSKTKLFD